MLSSRQSSRCLNFICYAYLFHFGALNVAYATFNPAGFEFNAYWPHGEDFGHPLGNSGPRFPYYKPDVSSEFFKHRPSGFGANGDYRCGRNIKVSRLTEPFGLSTEPHWDTESRSLYFVDAPGNTVYRYEIDNKQLYFAKLGSGNATITGLVPVTGVPGKYLSTYEDKLSVVSWDGVSEQGSYEILSQPDPYHTWPEYFLTDVKIVPSGAALFYSKPVPSPTTGYSLLPRRQSSLYSIVNGQQKTLLSNLDYGNGIGYSHDGEWLYHSDTVQNITYKSRYDQQTNSISDTRVLVNYAVEAIPGGPASLTVDKQGYLWIALNSGSGIIKVDPNSGEVVCFMKLPAASISNLAFGECPNVRTGNLDCLYVTTSSQQTLSPTIYDGSMLLIEGTGSEGVLPNRVQWNEIAGRAPFSYRPPSWSLY